MSILYNLMQKIYSDYPNPQPTHMGLKRMDTDDEQLLPQPKRIRLTDPEESDSDSDDDVSRFDPNAYYNTASQDTTAKCVSEFIDVAFKKCLPRKARKDFAEEFPRPAVDSAQVPTTDSILVDFMANDFPKKQDEQLSKIQASVIAPLANLWSELDAQEMKGAKSELIPADVVLRSIQATLTLIRNANNYISIQRRENIIKAIPKRLQRSTQSTKVLYSQARIKQQAVTLPPIGGRLSKFQAAWSKVDAGAWVMEVISQGYRLEFNRTPPTKLNCPSSSLSQVQTIVMDQEVHDLMKKEVIEVCLDLDGFFSPIFIVPKKDGGWRPIINLKALNQYLNTQHFKMESIYTLRDILKLGDYMGRIDLKDAYFSIKIHPNHKKFLKFRWRGILYQYRALYLLV